MNTKGQGLNFINVFAVALVFIIFFAIGLAPMISSILGGLDFSVYTGFESWILTNLNIWFFGFFAIAILIAIVWGLSRE